VRNMSFSMTTEPVRRREKDVTRRLGWWDVKPGELVQAVEKCQGLRKGEHVVRIDIIRILETRPEPLWNLHLYAPSPAAELTREGFPGQTAQEFIDLFVRHNHCDEHTIVNRIVFEYVDEVPA